MSLPLFLWKLNLSWSDHLHYSSTQPAATVRTSSPSWLGLLCWKIKSPKLTQPPLGPSMVPLLVGCAQQGGLGLWNEPRQGALCVWSGAWEPCRDPVHPEGAWLFPAALWTPLLPLQRTAQGSGPKADQWVNGCAELWQEGEAQAD